MLCKNCGQKNDDDGKYCIKCGFTLKPSGKKRVEDVFFIPQKESKKTTNNWLLSIVAVIVIGLVLIILVSASNDNFSSSSTSTGTITSSASDQWQSFTSVEQKVSAMFPTYPSTSREPEVVQENGYSYSSTQYSSTDRDGVDYILTVGDYNIAPNNYENKTGLEGMINYMNKPGEINITNTEFTKQNGYDAVSFSFNGIKENYSGKGLGVIRDDLTFIKNYIILIGSETGYTPNYQKFINSLEFK